MCDAYYMVGVSHWYRHIKTSIPHRETPWSLTSDHGVSLCGILVLFLIILSIPPSKFPQFCFDINQRKHTSPFGNKKISSFQPCLVVKSMLLWSKEQGLHRQGKFLRKTEKLSSKRASQLNTRLTQCLCKFIHVVIVFL